MIKPLWTGLCVAGLLAAFVGGTLWGLGADHDGDFPAGYIILTKNKIRNFVGLSKAKSKINDDISSNIKLPCPVNPVVVVTGGQSNSANAVSSPLDVGTNSNAYMFFDGYCYAIRDPILGANGIRGSIWSRFAPALAARLQRPVVIISGAIGGSQFADWIDPKLPYMRLLRDRVMDASRKIGPADIVLWHQGETDAWFKPRQSDIQPVIFRVTSTVMSTYAVKPGAKLVLYQASICTGERRKQSTAAVINAQAAVAAADPRVILGPNTDLLGRRYRHDDCHFNDVGAQIVANQTVDLVSQLLTAN